MDLLTGFAGSAEDLAGLTAGVRPYDAWRPSRPAAMALDLAEPARPAAVLALAQYRALGPERLTGRLQFDGPAQKMVALRGFDAIYADRTARTLRGLGTTSPERRAELLKFLTGPLARLDLLAPEQKEREVRIAVALAAIGLRQAGAAVLTNAIKAGHDTFEVNVELAGIQEAQAERGEALKHLRRALELRPDDASVRGHIVALLLSTGQEGEAADMLEEMVRRDPDNAAQLLELGYLYAKLKRYQDAASAAERVLRIDPGNQDAQALLSATQQVPAPQPPDASGSETPPESRRDGGAT
jgi:tetratricopeptide (TPR) repeat protein